MESQPINNPSIWQALDDWAKKLKPWQRQILALATQNGCLSTEQVSEVYQFFLEQQGLSEKKPREEIALDVSGRPTEALIEKFCIDRVDELIGVNAIPTGAAVTFGPGLTVLYGRNGVGKSGFARLLANVCFSRHKPKILGNVYEEGTQLTTSARFLTSVDGVDQEPLVFTIGSEIAELKRFSFFDTTVARLHIAQAAPFEFKPSGFDVFTEMVRVYSLLAFMLDGDIKARTDTKRFSESFIGSPTVVSKAVAALDASNNDLTELRQLAVYGETEDARIAEVDRQLVALKSNSPQEAILRLKEARTDIQSLEVKFKELGVFFTVEQAARRTTLAEKVKKQLRQHRYLAQSNFAVHFLMQLVRWNGRVIQFTAWLSRANRILNA